MVKLCSILLAAVLAATSGTADSLLVVSWNLENFFDNRADGTSDSEAEFSSSGRRHWSARRLDAKCAGISKVLLMIADSYGRLPDAVALQEVENRRVLKRLISGTALRKLDYAIVHFDSPDHRGIDCALFCRKSTLKLLRAHPAHIFDGGEPVPTRDILVAEFDSLAILVNHHPSKVGGKDSRRALAMARMMELCDSLGGRILCVGDFNDDLWHNGGPGTIKYNGEWEKIDGHFAFGGLSVREEVFCSGDVLLEEDRGFGGLKPRRTYVGLKYNGGISDHLPLALIVYFR